MDMLRSNKRRRQLNKVKEGNGEKLKDYKKWHIFTRTVFYIKIKNDKDELVDYAINYPYFVEEPRAELYRAGKQVAYSKLPATFSIEDGVIEVSSGSYGIKRMHYVDKEGKEYPLHPDNNSVRGLRLRLEKKHPTLSKLVGCTSICLLLLTAILGLPQILEGITQIPWVSDNFGTFVSPINFNYIENILIAGIGALAGAERALLLRNKRLLALL